MTLAIKVLTPTAGMSSCPLCKKETFGYAGDGSSHLAICLEGTELEVCLSCARKSSPELTAVLAQAQKLSEARALMARQGTVGAFRILGALLRPEPKKQAKQVMKLEGERRRALPG